MKINNIDYMKLVNQRNALAKENTRLKRILIVQGVLWEDNKQYIHKDKPITDMVVHDGRY